MLKDPSVPPTPGLHPPVKPHAAPAIRPFIPGRSRVAIIGAGIMGPGIAQVFAEAGYSVDLCDIDEAVLARALAAFHDGLALKVELGLISSAASQDASRRVQAQVLSDGVLAQADLIIEAVTEKADVKRELFARIQRQAPPTAVVWSNTSTLDVFALAPGDLLERMVVAHWFAPPHILPLVEVVAPSGAQRHTLEASVACLRDLGKSPVVLQRFVPGFLINRLLRALGREAFYLLDEGVVSIEDLDVAVRTSLAPRMQMLGLMQRYDFTGLGLSLRNLENPQMVDAPVDLSPRILRERVERGELGIATGRGFYDYGVRDRLTLQRERDKKLWAAVAALGDAVGDPKPI